jgi:hypothetical protein
MRKNKTITEIKKPIETIELETEIKELNYIGRGFATLEEAKDFPNTEVFKKLGKADRDEYLNWLK